MASNQVVCHTGLPKDKRRAAEIMNAVKERYGHVIHVSRVHGQQTAAYWLLFFVLQFFPPSAVAPIMYHVVWPCLLLSHHLTAHRWDSFAVDAFNFGREREKGSVILVA